MRLRCPAELGRGFPIRSIQQAIKNAGHILEYLPPYSPDFNPIEHKWAQLKAIRKRERCTTEEVFANYA
ncbi:hypothetical protein CCP3SC1_40071 [Gammaproteobacteria bacterium]